MVSIFMSLTNVHANWFPVDGTVKLSECFIGEHLGFIKFGSRVDTYLPPVTEILVGMNQSTTGNRTVIARLKPFGCFFPVGIKNIDQLHCALQPLLWLYG